jgi:hypothetical protein
MCFARLSCERTRRASHGRGSSLTLAMKKEQVMPELLEVCPSFASTWKALDEDERDLLYPRLGDFARHLLAMKREGREDVLRAAGDFIERMHVEGDDYVREACTIGALEGIQNVWAHAGEDADAFRAYLGDESLRWWQSLHQFWEGKIPYVGADIQKG